ncbi:MAG: tetratricopeptide repeat protein [Planctomycetota bacterium]|jgi:tetratricopeptide (TPR) repeat protein|nr:tetratricopeptide repeat protein [Planctomycetota bacterium]
MVASDFPILLTLDDLDPKAPKVSKLTTSRNGGSSSIRLAVLLAILIPLAVFGYLHNRYTSSIQRIEKSLAMWDDPKALREIKAFEKDSGLSAESAFYRARAYRHQGDDVAFSQFSGIAKQLGYSEEKLTTEKLLREIQGGLVPNMDTAIATAMSTAEPELGEIGPAVVYGRLGKLEFDKADAFLKFWSETDPKTPWIDFFRGMLAISGRDADRATELLEGCARSYPEFVPVYRQLASAYLLSRDSERAVLALQRFIKSNPQDLDAIGLLGTALFNLDRLDEVVKLFEPWVESGKATIDMRMTLSRIYSAKNEPKKVVDILSSVASLWPEDVRIANLLSQAHQSLGNAAESDRFAKVAEAGQADVQSIDGRLARLMSGTDRQAQQHYELGHILLHKQSREEGLYWLNLALGIDETFLPAHEDLVQYFTRISKPEYAARHQRYINLRRGVQ